MAWELCSAGHQSRMDRPGHNGERVENCKKCKDKENREDLRLSGTHYSCVNREKRGEWGQTLSSLSPSDDGR